MESMSLRLNGVCNAYFQEHRILDPGMVPKDEACACTSASLFWNESGERNHLLVDIGYGVWRSLVDQAAYSEPAKLSGILITHQHLDHIGELVPFVESSYRLLGEPIDIYATGTVFDFLASSYPWLFNVRRGKEKLKANAIKPGERFRIGKLDVLPVDASSHCKGGVNYLIDSSLAKIFIGWDLNHMPKDESIDWAAVDVAFLDGNTIEDHPTGHCSIRTLLKWAKAAGPRNIGIVHYSGWEDGRILSPTERMQRAVELAKEIGVPDCCKIEFGYQGQIYNWGE